MHRGAWCHCALLMAGLPDTLCCAPGCCFFLGRDRQPLAAAGVAGRDRVARGLWLGVCVPTMELGAIEVLAAADAAISDFFGRVFYCGTRSYLVPGCLAATRNFFGTLRVQEVVDPWGQLPTVRKLMHGQINHGSQVLSPDLQDLPLSYYGPGSGNVPCDHAASPPGAGLAVACGRAGSRGGDDCCVCRSRRRGAFL